MKHIKFGKTIILRLDPGDDIIDSILRLANIEDIRLAEISGIGATDNIEIGIFNLKTKKYDIKKFSGNYEITNLSGSLTLKDNDYYQHIHITAANSDGKCVGGHLLKARISLTAEIIINVIDGKIERKFNKKLNINQLQ